MDTSIIEKTALEKYCFHLPNRLIDKLASFIHYSKFNFLISDDNTCTTLSNSKTVMYVTTSEYKFLKSLSYTYEYKIIHSYPNYIKIDERVLYLSDDMQAKLGAYIKLLENI